MKIRDGAVTLDALDTCYDCAIRHECEDLKTFALVKNTIVNIAQFCEGYKRPEGQ